MGLFPRVRRASVFLGVALVLPSAPVECSCARRRHHPTSANHVSGDGKPPLVFPQDGMIREESSIPGVSIWTSKTAASFSRTPARGVHTAAAASTSYYHGDDEAAVFSGGCQVGFDGIMGRGFRSALVETYCLSMFFLWGAVELGLLLLVSSTAVSSQPCRLGHVGERCEQHTPQMCAIMDN